MVTYLIVIYLLIPLAAGVALGFLGNPEKWKPTVMIGAVILFSGQSLLKSNPSWVVESTMNGVGIVIGLGALSMGRGVVMVFRQQQLDKNKTDRS